MPKITSHNVSMKMCFWNVGGIISKYNDKTNDSLFLKNIEKYDIVFLVEHMQVPI
jgi:hypothetical protein